MYIYIYASRLHSKWGRRKAEYIDSSSASPPGEKPAQVSGGRRGVARLPNRALGRSGRDQAPGTRGAPRASARFRRVGKEEPVGAGRCTRPAWVKYPTSPGGRGRDRTRVRGGRVLQGRCPWTPSNLRVSSPPFPGGRPDPLPPRQIAAPHSANMCVWFFGRGTPKRGKLQGGGKPRLRGLSRPKRHSLNGEPRRPNKLSDPHRIYI